MYPRRSIVAAMLAVSAMGGVHAQTVSAGGYSLTVIGDLGGPRDSRTYGSTVSADGKTIAGFSQRNEAPYDLVAFSWSAATGWQKLAAPANAIHSSVQAVSADGRISVGSISTPQTDSSNVDRWAVRWPGDGRTQNLFQGVSEKYMVGTAEVTNRDGSIVAGSFHSAANGNAMFRWDQHSGFRALTVGDFAGQFLAMNQAGDAATGFVGNVDGVYGSRAFIWTERAGIRMLPTNDASATKWDMGWGVTADGQTVVGGIATGQVLSTPGGIAMLATEAARWTNGGTVIERLGMLDGDNYSSASAVSADGHVVIGSSGNSKDFAERTFIWTPGSGLRSLDALLRSAGVPVGTLSLTGLIGLSPDGRTVTGQGYREDDPEGRPQFWQVHIDAATLRALPAAAPGADARRAQASMLKLDARAVATKRSVAMHGDVCQTPTGRALLVRCRLLPQRQ
ncbi:calcium-binding protein [Burkholderia contaminans]|uniref:calcium-binding protein n=1 Tax=Burkholderia contaminans TaxID=488447 RepID=UPI0014539179|nr:calcium-binding protein [Burkholderia contaminans]VWD33909.1 calcium-binding protein [Burkholderia contaminans]